MNPNPFSTQTRPTEIVITPVNNGWIVTMPDTCAVNPLMETITDTFKGITNSLQGQNELQEIINKSNAKQPVEAPPFVRDGNVYIFTTFREALAFLKVTIDE